MKPWIYWVKYVCITTWTTNWAMTETMRLSVQGMRLSFL